MTEADDMHSSLQVWKDAEQQCRESTIEFTAQCSAGLSSVEDKITCFGRELGQARESMNGMVLSVQQAVESSAKQVETEVGSVTEQLKQGFAELHQQEVQAGEHEAEKREAEQQALTEIDQKIRSCVADHVKKSSSTVESLSAQVAQHDSKLCEMAQLLQTAVEQAKTEMADLVAQQTDRVQQSTEVADDALKEMTAHGKLHHGHIEGLDSLLQEQVASKLEQLQSSLDALKEHTTSTSSAQLEMLTSQKNQLAAAATAHKEGERHQATRECTEQLAQAASAAEQQQQSMLELIEATLRQLAQSQSEDGKAAEDGLIGGLESLKSLVDAELKHQRQMVEEQIDGLQKCFECGEEGNREEELLRRLETANENATRVQQEQNALIEQQAAELAECKRQLLETQSTQEAGRQRLAAELMEGIGSLVEQQVSSLAQQFNSQYEKLDKTHSSLVQRNTSVSESVDEMAKLRQVDKASVSSEAAEWGEANREVGQMIQQAQQEGRDLQDAMQEHLEKVSSDVSELCDQTNAWGQNSAAVATKVLSEADATAKTNEAVVSAAAATQQHAEAIQSEVQTWAGNDSKCQKVLSAIDTKHTELADRISQDHTETAEAVCDLASGTQAATEFNSDAMTQTAELIAESNQASEHRSTFADELSAARKLELESDNAINQAVAAETAATLNAVQQIHAAAPMAEQVVPQLESSQQAVEAMQSAVEASQNSQQEMVQSFHQDRANAWSQMLDSADQMHSAQLQHAETALGGVQSTVAKTSKTVHGHCESLQQSYATQQSEVAQFQSTSTESIGQISADVMEFGSSVVHMNDPVDELAARASIECPDAIKAVKAEADIEASFHGNGADSNEAECSDEPAVEVEAEPEPELPLASPQVQANLPAHRRSPQTMLVQSPAPVARSPAPVVRSPAPVARSPAPVVAKAAKAATKSKLQAPGGKSKLQPPGSSARTRSKAVITA